MQQRVTAILVARSGAEYLQRTLADLDAQTRAPDFVVAVDVGSIDRSAELLAASSAAQLVAAPPKSSFGEAVAHALHVAAPAASGDEWLWLLAHDNAPEPGALAGLLAAVEIAPSVAVAGPKLMRLQQREVIAEFGESMTEFGTSVRLVEGELDQAQHDVNTDVLGVAAAGMLVRRTVWTELGGFDPGLPSTDAALDFCVRARLAGHRVVVVPGAKVASAGGPQYFGRNSVSDARRTQIARAAQLHRRLVYAPAAALPLHWLTLLPLAILRSIVHLLAKRPGAVGAELATAITLAVNWGPVTRARRNLRRTRTLGWKAIAPLRIPWRKAKEQRAHRRELNAAAHGPVVYSAAPIGFIAGGGLWAVAGAAVVGLIAFGQLAGASSVVGGGLVPLGDDVGSLWAQVGYGWRQIGVGFVGAADPFTAVLALLGTATFWQPSSAIVVLYLLALPLAAVGAWFCARRFSATPWLPAVAALLWAVAPPLLWSLQGGHLGAVVAHLLLPWLVLLGVNGARSWASAAAAALLFAVVIASAPSLAPALLVMWFLWMLSRPRSAHRIAGIPLPAAALFAPLVIDQLLRANLIGLLADPGLPAGGGTTSGIQLAFGSAGGGSNGWTALLDRLFAPAAVAPMLVAALLAPLAVLAILALFVRGTRRGIPALSVALLGYVTAVLASRIDVSYVGADVVALWSGAALSLFWLGLLGSALVAIDAIGRSARGAAVLLGVATVLASLPLIAAIPLGTSGVTAGTGRTLPAFVDAEATSRPDLGTLIIAPVGDGAISASLERGRGTPLEQQSTLDATATELSESDEDLATLAGNLASRSGFDASADLDDLAISFVVLEEADEDRDGAAAAFTRTREALDGNALFVPVGETSNGLLWRYVGGEEQSPYIGPGNTDTAWGVAVLAGQGLIFGMTLLLAIPTSRPQRRVVSGGAGTSEPATTFDEDTDD